MGVMEIDYKGLVLIGTVLTFHTQRRNRILRHRAIVECMVLRHIETPNSFRLRDDDFTSNES